MIQEYAPMNGGDISAIMIPMCRKFLPKML
jgi:hypothetical protein